MVSSLSYLANGKIGDIFVGFAHSPPKNTLPPYCYHANEKQLAMERLRNDRMPLLYENVSFAGYDSLWRLHRLSE